MDDLEKQLEELLDGLDICRDGDKEYTPILPKVMALIELMLAEKDVETALWREYLIDWICGEPAKDCNIRASNGYIGCQECEYWKKIPRKSVKRSDFEREIAELKAEIKRLHIRNGKQLLATQDGLEEKDAEIERLKEQVASAVDIMGSWGITHHRNCGMILIKEPNGEPVCTCAYPTILEALEGGEKP